MAHVTCTSPIDGHVYVQRPFTGADELAQKLQRAKAAQRGWQQRSIQERAALCSQMIDAMLAMRSEIIPELAWQMGRPVRFGGGELGGFEERARHMIAIAEDALAPIRPRPIDGLAAILAANRWALSWWLHPGTIPI